MIFTSDLIIKGKTASMYNKIKEDFSFNYIDIYLYSVLYGIDYKNEELSEKVVSGFDEDSQINIPRTVLGNNSDLIDLLMSISIIQEIDEVTDLSLKVAFEDTEEDVKSLQRFKAMHNLSMHGIIFLFQQLYSSRNNLEDEMTTLSGILNKYKGEFNEH